MNAVMNKTDYLLIENEGVSPVECFTVMGLSTSRGNADKIGQFGSGIKQAILLCLRAEVEPNIFIGEEPLVFFSRPATLENGHKYREVWYSWRGVETRLSYSFEFGAIDWTNLDMAMREIVSNAIDNPPYSVSVVDSLSGDYLCGKAGHTRFYIPYIPQVKEYHSQLRTNFLHFRQLEKLKFIPKADKSPPRIYRKGVFIRQLEENKAYGYCESLYDYNFDDSLPIDECRNMSDAICMQHIAGALSNNDTAIRTVFTAIRDERKIYELQVPYYSLHGNSRWEKIWNEVAGATLISTDKRLNQLAEKRNVAVVTLPAGGSSFFLEMQSHKVPTINSLIGTDLEKAVTFTKTRKDTEKKVIILHQKCRSLGRCGTKTDCPRIISFVKNTNNNETLRGYYDRKLKAVCINVDNATCSSTILEELAHYYTDADDFTRDMQNFAFNLAAMLLDDYEIA